MKNDVKPTAGQRPVYDALVAEGTPIFLVDLETALRDRGFTLSRTKVMKYLVRLKKRGLVESQTSTGSFSGVKTGSHLWKVVDRG